MFTELHFHTKETSFCGKVSAAEGVRAYKEYGYDAVVVTDHLYRSYYESYYNGKLSYEEVTDWWLGGYRAAKAEGDKCGLKVFLGCELSYDNGVADNDYLVFGMTEDMFYKNREIWAWNEERFKSFADEHGLFVSQAHPFRGWCKPCPKEYLHGTEMFNAHNHHNSHNDLALKRWLDTGLIPTCGTDFHDPDANLGCGVRFRKDAETIYDIIAMLRSGEYELVIPQNYRYFDADR